MRIVIALRHVPESRDAEAPPGLDWPGAVLAFGGLGGVVFGLIASPDRGWRDPTVAIATGGGVILLMLFLWAQWRSRAPMMPLDLFRSRVFSGVNLLTLLHSSDVQFVFTPLDGAGDWSVDDVYVDPYSKG